MLKALLLKEEWDALASETQEHYVEEDGVYRLAVTPAEGFELANTVALKKALQAEKAGAKKAKADHKALTETVGDLDLAAARDALNKVEEMAGMDPEGKAKAAQEAFEKSMSAQFEADRKKLLAKHEEETGALTKRGAALQVQLERQLIVSAAAKALAGFDGAPELMIPIVERTTKMKERDDGTFEAVVLDDEGMERLSPVAGSTNPMTISELVKELSDDKKFARAFGPNGASGSGAGRSGARSGSGASHVISREDAKDPQKYRTAKEAAVKAGKTLELAPA